MSHYTVLTGAKINVGDFLITDRCKKLIRRFKPDHELIQRPHWEPLDAHLDEVNAGAAVIILGGPGYQKTFYPGVYTFASNPADIRVPIIPMGLGWKGFPGDEATLKAYTFTGPATEMLRRIATEAPYLGCRDYLTQAALEQNGFSNTLMTGCPVWYDLDHIGEGLDRPETIERVVFTPPQRKIYQKQAIETLAAVRELFPDAELYCSFHRGISQDNAYTKGWHIKHNEAIAAAAEELGCRIVDAAYDLERIAFYADCDLHVGYRVHGHIHFLSQRKPSLLIHEDGRGRGVSDALNVAGIDGFRSDLMALITEQLQVGRFSHDLRAALGGIRAEADVPERVVRRLRQDVANDFARYAGLPAVIDAHFEVMKSFVEAIPD